jgi:hypothetical protein
MEGNTVKKVSYQDKINKILEILRGKKNHLLLKSLMLKMAESRVVDEVVQQIMGEAISVVRSNGMFSPEAVETLHKRAIEANERYHMEQKRKRG